MSKRAHSTAALTQTEREERRWKRQDKERRAAGVPLERGMSDRAPRRAANASPDDADPVLGRLVEETLANGLATLVAWAVDRQEAAAYLRQVRDPMTPASRISLSVDAPGSSIATAVKWIEYLVRKENYEREALPENVAAILYWRVVAGLSWRSIAKLISVYGAAPGDPGASHESCRKHYQRAISVICFVFRDSLKKPLPALTK